MAVGLQFYLSHNYKEFQGCEATIDFCLRINNIFDALNRKQPNEGLTPQSKDFKVNNLPCNYILSDYNIYFIFLYIQRCYNRFWKMLLYG